MKNRGRWTYSINGVSIVEDDFANFKLMDRGVVVARSYSPEDLLRYALDKGLLSQDDAKDMAEKLSIQTEDLW